MRTFASAFLAASSFLLPAATAPAQTAVPTERRVVLVELFTSEGCSSCPPADALLRELNGTRVSSGAEVIGIGEHVTYWDYLGWHDRYDKPVFDDRQKAYSDRFGKDGVYTPQMVVNGEAEMVGSDRAAVRRALARPLPASSMRVKVKSAAVVGGQVEIAYHVTGDSNESAELFAAVVQDAPGAKVSRGENAGTTLAHAGVARGFVRVGLVHGESEGTSRVAMVTLLTASNAPEMRVVLFAQRVGLGPVLAVDAAPLRATARHADRRR